MVSKIQETTDIVIVGGGLAGLTAAQIFEEQNIPYVLLEGSDKLGGRISTVQWQGGTLELGAQWVTGCSSKNPIYQIAIEQLNLQGQIDEQNENGSIMVRSSQGKDITSEALKVMDKLTDYIDVVCE